MQILAFKVHNLSQTSRVRNVVTIIVGLSSSPTSVSALALHEPGSVSCRARRLPSYFKYHNRQALAAEGIVLIRYKQTAGARFELMTMQEFGASTFVISLRGSDNDNDASNRHWSITDSHMYTLRTLRHCQTHRIVQDYIRTDKEMWTFFNSAFAFQVSSRIM